MGLQCCHVQLGWHPLPVGHAEVVGVPVQFASAQSELEELRSRYQITAADLDKVRYVLAVQARQRLVAWARWFKQSQVSTTLVHPRWFKSEPPGLDKGCRDL